MRLGEFTEFFTFLQNSKALSGLDSPICDVEKNILFPRIWSCDSIDISYFLLKLLFFYFLYSVRDPLQNPDNDIGLKDVEQA